MVIANGLSPHILKELFHGKDVGTLFLPRRQKMACRKCWIAFTLKEKGAIKVDKGAIRAICEQGKSLLPVGITGVKGNFREGDMVGCLGPDDISFAKGLVNYKAADIRKLKGLKTDQIKDILGHKYYDEVIHRDNLVITVDETGKPTCQ
ncbi:MAG: hypothetical protein JRF28_03960 [Deltaproteobacteria bacterium]|nr:hypothetical protein [Deltaproteobacteria bacterium]